MPTITAAVSAWARRFAALPTLLAAISVASAVAPIKLRVASVSVPSPMHTLYMQVAYGAKSIPVEAWADLKFQDEAVRQIGAVAE